MTENIKNEEISIDDKAAETAYSYAEYLTTIYNSLMASVLGAHADSPEILLVHSNDLFKIAEHIRNTIDQIAAQLGVEVTEVDQDDSEEEGENE